MKDAAYFTKMIIYLVFIFCILIYIFHTYINISYTFYIFYLYTESVLSGVKELTWIVYLIIGNLVEDKNMSDHAMLPAV